MWEPERREGCTFYVNRVQGLPPGQQEMDVWHIFGDDASARLGQISIFPDIGRARITKGLEDGEVMEIDLGDENEYPTRLFKHLFLVNRGK